LRRLASHSGCPSFSAIGSNRKTFNPDGSTIAADRKTIRYRSRRPPETELRARLRDLANERRRFGYRRLFILLRREGEASGINRIYRLYREEGLGVRRFKGRKRSIGVRAPILVEARPNARWSLDFCARPDGQRLAFKKMSDDGMVSLRLFESTNCPALTKHSPH
jgi:helix-turn-helix protein